MTDTTTARFAPFDWRGFIAFPADVDLAKIVQSVYARSVPKGLGMLHFQAGPLDDQRVTDAIAKANEKFTAEQAGPTVDYSGEGRESKATFFDFDYVDGRAVKFRLYRDLNTEAFYADLDWYDHGPWDVLALVADTFGVDDTQATAILSAADLAKTAKAVDEFNAKAAKALPLLRQIRRDGPLRFLRDSDEFKAITARPSVEFAYDLDGDPLFKTKYNYDDNTSTFNIDVGGEKLLAAETVSA
ncbi:hypothetical protein HOT99_gp018 [Caulobacter phage CcrBL10]|uniref:Uncharacterized protein n=1 Tax=Caulobacter phage CcrBL10 TaxID=2283269 RepID=A0A385EBH8_9CAUD|nr:hypothetical protein HOT99_gp018 [Caulobacter phage CcrBL10]AXQ68222.1 hypothetical protein CcrBL10_gp018 [Caulobacter phage CcrBL10]